LSDFNKKHKFTKCSAPLDEHAAFGEDVAFIVPKTEVNDLVTCGYMNDELELGLSISFSKKQMPWLIIWQHWGKNEYVTALEPATNPPIGQAAARKNGTLILLEPGESRTYEIKLNVLKGDAVKEFKI
jgi:galactose mutarotase-like enzyme